MKKQYGWKHLGIALVLIIALCAGFLLYNQWDLARFRKSFVQDTTQTPQKQQSTKLGETSQQLTTLTPSEIDDDIERSILHESDSENNKIEVAGNEKKDVEEATFDDFLEFLDELETDEMAKLIESLDLEDDEMAAFTELTEQESEITEDIYPSDRIIDMIESGVASLTGLIELMEESTTVMPESVQERFEPVLDTLRTMQANNGALIVHRLPENPSSPMLMFINPSPSSRWAQNPSSRGNNVRYEFVPNDPNMEPLILDEGNSTIVD